MIGVVKATIVKPSKYFPQLSEVYVVNPDESIWDKHYLVSIDYYSIYYVIADSEQSALDIVIDYLEENDCKGYFYSDSDLEEKTEEEINNLLIAGNHCRYIANDHLIIEQL